jgi:hypothetical protein
MEVSRHAGESPFKTAQIPNGDVSLQGLGSGVK